MPLTAIRTVATAQNGVGAFVRQCKKMIFQYSEWNGSSKEMKLFFEHHLPKFARSNPDIEMVAAPRAGKHPCIIAYFINGNLKSVPVRKKKATVILEKATLLSENSGESKLGATKKNVISENESVRGVWSPHHTEETYKV